MTMLLSSLEYDYSEDCIELLRPLLFEERKDDTCWQSIRLQLANSKSNRYSNSNSNSNININISLAHDVSLCLLADCGGVIVMSNTQYAENTKEQLDATLNACGADACLVACCRILVDLSNTNNRKRSNNTRNGRLVTVLPLVLRTIRRQYLTPLKSLKKNLSWTDQIEHTASPPAPEETEEKESHDNDQTASIRVISQLLLRMPVLISNACLGQKLQLPSWAVRDVYMSRLLRCSLIHTFSNATAAAATNTTTTTTGKSTRHEQVLMQNLIRRMVQTGASAAVARGMWDYHHQNERDSPRECESFYQKNCWDAIPTQRDRLKLLHAIVEDTFQQQYSLVSLPWKDQCETLVLPYLSQTCLPCWNKSSSLARRFVTSVLLSKATGGSPRSNRMLAHALVLLLNQCRPTDSNSDSSDSGDDDSVKYSVLEQCTHDIVESQWSTRRFVHHASCVVQHRVTYFLRSSLPLLNSLSIKKSLRTLYPLMRGVTVRLESSLNDCRFDGLRVAELLAEIWGAHVHFSELDEDDDAEEKMEELMEEPVPTTSKQALENGPSENDTSVLIMKRTRRRNLDPDAEYQSSDSEDDEDGDIHDDDDDDSLEWDDDLIPLDGYQNDSEEDLHETSPPLYLRECLELLQTPESHELAASRHETALCHVEALIRSRPLDLIDVAVPLAQQLLRMEDKFDMQEDDIANGESKFDGSVRCGLVALAVTESISIGDILIDFIFDDVSLLRRMVALYTLERAALELSGADAVERNQIDMKAKLCLEPGYRVSGKRRLVPHNNGTNTSGKANEAMKTQRWGRLNQNSNKQTKSSFVNRFTGIAPRWFYALMGRFMDRRNDAKLWGGANGVRLLAHLLITLSTFCECNAGALSAGGAMLSKELLEFAWTFRTADDATLRSAVLGAVSSSLTTTDEGTLVQMLQDRHDLPDFLADVIQTDPHQVCRQQAQIISKQVLQILEQSCVGVDGYNGNSLL